MNKFEEFICDEFIIQGKPRIKYLKKTDIYIISQKRNQTQHLNDIVLTELPRKIINKRKLYELVFITVNPNKYRGKRDIINMFRDEYDAILAIEDYIEEDKTLCVRNRYEVRPYYRLKKDNTRDKDLVKDHLIEKEIIEEINNVL